MVNINIVSFAEKIAGRELSTWEKEWVRKMWEASDEGRKELVFVGGRIIGIPKETREDE